MQLAKIIHLKFLLKAGFHLIDHVHITWQGDGVVYIYEYNYSVMINLQNFL